MKKTIFLALFILTGFNTMSQNHKTTYSNTMGLNLASAFDKNGCIFYEHIFKNVGIRPFYVFPLLNKPNKYDPANPVFKYNARNLRLGIGLDIKLYTGNSDSKLRYYIGPSVGYFSSKYYVNANYKDFLVTNGLTYIYNKFRFNGGFAAGMEKVYNYNKHSSKFYTRFELGVGFSF